MDPSVAAGLPGWVGRRVVVRHLLPDGRATDVLGTLLRVDRDVDGTIDGTIAGGRLAVRRDRLRDGEGEDARTVEVALADVLLAKPVPPPVTRRARDRR